MLPHVNCIERTSDRTGKTRLLNISFLFFLTLVYIPLFFSPAFSQENSGTSDALTKNPGDLTNILIEDEAAKEALITPAPLDPLLKPWERFKQDLHEQTGLKVGIAHTSAYQNANTSFAGQGDAAGGILAILGD